MRYLKEDMKKNAYKRVYLLYGEERYLVKHYEHEFARLLLADGGTMMNRDTFDGKDISISAVMDAADTMPFLSEYRLVYVRDSGLFTTGRKDDTEAMAGYLARVPDSAILIFVETDVDKRNRLYKKVVEIGRVVDFATPKESELVQWLGKVFNKKGKSISAQNALLLLKTAARSMDALYMEADKLGDFVGERTTITAEDIATVCSPSLETQIFALVGAVGEGRGAEALRMYHDMLLLKEQPMMILTMIIRQFRMILQCKACADKRMTPGAMAAALNLRSFIVTECLKQGRHFTTERLLEALRDCHQTDTGIKSGLLSDKLGVELLIIRYADGTPSRQEAVSS